jgi:hypothetical protein
MLLGGTVGTTARIQSNNPSTKCLPPEALLQNAKTTTKTIGMSEDHDPVRCLRRQLQIPLSLNHQLSPLRQSAGSASILRCFLFSTCTSYDHLVVPCRLAGFNGPFYKKVAPSLYLQYPKTIPPVLCNMSAIHNFDLKKIVDKTNQTH